MSPYPGKAGGRPGGARRSAKPRRGDLIAWAGIAALVVGGGAFVVRQQQTATAQARDDTTHCLLHSTPPTSVMVLLDQTDTLGRDAGKRFDDLMATTVRALPRNGRLTVVPFGGDLGQSLASRFSGCSPGKRTDASAWSEAADDVQWDYDNTFLKPLADVSRQLLAARPSGQSPIAEQIERAINDPAIPWDGGHRELVVMTDGLEFTDNSKIYKGAPMRLPDPAPGTLTGVTVRYVELANPAHSELQTQAVRKAWEAWFIAAGADKVIMVAQGFARPDG